MFTITIGTKKEVGGMPVEEVIKDTNGYDFVGENMTIGLADGRTWLVRPLSEILYWKKVEQPVVNPHRQAKKDKKKGK